MLSVEFTRNVNIKLKVIQKKKEEITYCNTVEINFFHFEILCKGQRLNDPGL